MNQYINSREQDVPIQPPYRPCDPKGPSRSVNGAIPGTGAKAKATAPVVLASSRSVLLENKRYDGGQDGLCLLYTSPSPRDRQKSRMPSSA